MMIARSAKSLLIVILTHAACWSDPSPCALWSRKLGQGQEVQAAVQQLRVGQCVAARPLLLEHLKDPGLGPDVLEALVALGRGPEAEAAVRRSLASHETVDAAARQVVAWRLEGAEPELRAALADATLASHHGALLAAALAIAPAARWLDELARAATSDSGGATADRALEALAGVAWGDVPAERRHDVVAALAELATRPERALPTAQMDKVLSILGALASATPPALVEVVARARAGERMALLVLWALAHPEAAMIAQTLAVRADVDRAARWLALAIWSGAAPEPEIVARSSVEGDVALGLALVVGPGAGSVLAARRGAEKGAGRAALARAEAVVLTAPELDLWAKGLEGEASVLLRGIVEEPAIAGVAALTRRCGGDAACLAGLLDERGARLATLDADLTAARSAVAAARAQADLATAKDAERAKELAQVQGEGLAAARAELDAIRQRTASAYAEVARRDDEVARLASLELEVVVALRRLVGTGAEVGAAAARRALEGASGPACGTIRAWAVAVLLSGPPLVPAERAALVLRAR